MTDWIVIGTILVVGAIIGFLVLAYCVSNNKLKPPFKQPATHIVNAVWGITFLVFVVAGITAMYDSADKSGWFAHERKVSVWIGNDWLVGEFKSCALSEHKKAPSMYCTNSQNETVHEMNVEFRGSMGALDDQKPSDWICQRKESLIACKTDAARSKR
jgi:hypothetical protein